MALTLPVDQHIILEQMDYYHAERLHELVKANREYLRVWLPWVDHMRTVDDFRKYIQNSKHRFLAKLEIGYVIMVHHELVGRIGLNHLDLYNKSASIGYWIDQSLQGKGIITKCCSALLGYAFTELNLNRVEIRCGKGNNKSRAIPERLNFTHEGVAREAELVNNQFLDLHIFSLLKKEWKPNS